MATMVAAVAAPGTFVFLSALLTPWVRRRVPQHRDACALAFFFAVQIAILSVAAEEPWLTALIAAVAAGGRHPRRLVLPHPRLALAGVRARVPDLGGGAPARDDARLSAAHQRARIAPSS